MKARFQPPRFRVVTCLACCLAMLGLSAQGARAQATLSKDSNLSIVTEGSFGNADVVLKPMLEKYLLRVLKKTALGGPGEPVRFVLVSRAATWRDLALEKLPSITEIDAYEIDTKTPREVRIIGETAMAVGYGITDFLERHLGVFWLFPGELGVCIPDVQEVRLPALKERVVPAVASRAYTGLELRGIDAARLPNEGVVMDERGYFKADDALKSRRMRFLIYSSHAMIRIFPIEESKKRHPEIFPTKDGQRWFPPEDPKANYYQAWHPCYSNPKTVEVATQKAKEFFERKEGLVFSLGINDGRCVQCQCEECRKIGFPDSYYRFVNQVADNVKSYYPPCMVGVLAYQDVALPPENLKLRANVLVNTGGLLGTWFRHAGWFSVYQYFYGHGFWVPSFPLKAMKQNARIFREKGILAHHTEIHPLWAFDAPKFYLNNQLMWNPGFDADKGLDRWCRVGFGAAWEPIRDFYRIWVALRDNDQESDGLFPMCPELGTYYRQSTRQFAAVPDGTFSRARACLDRAAELVKPGLEQKRLDMLNAFFGYSETLAQMYELRAQVFDTSSKRDWSVLVKQSGDLLNRRAKILENMRAHPEWFVGTLQTVDRILGNTWEGRWEWSLDYEAENARRTALFQANRGGTAGSVALSGVAVDERRLLGPCRQVPLDFERLDNWTHVYHVDIYNPMGLDAGAEIVRFALDPSAPKRVSPESPHKAMSPNGLKKHYFRGMLPLKQGRDDLFEFEMTGKQGTLEFVVANENDCGKKVYLKETLGAKEETRRKALLLKPVPFWGNQRPVANWLVSVVFTPDSESAEFRGSCAVRKLEFLPAWETPAKVRP